MTTLILIWLAVGFFSYWPLVWHYKIAEQGAWYEWICAWAVWCVSWPYWNVMNAWYWWRAKK